MGRTWRWILVAWTAIAAVALTAAAADRSLPGPYPAGITEVEVVRDDGSTFLAWLYYPALGAGALAPPDPSAAPFPAVVFAHGYLGPPLLYAGTYEHLASWGYMVLAPRSGLELFPSHAAFAQDMRDALDHLEQRDATFGDPFYGLVDVDAFGASGHSMGAGVAALAAAADPRFRALAVLAPAETVPSAIAAVAGLEVPACWVVGDADLFTPLERHARPLHEAVPSRSLLAILRGGDHCGFLDPEFPRTLCGNGTLAPERQQALAREMLTAFFDLYLREDADAWVDTWGPRAAFVPDLRIEPRAGFELTPFFQVGSAPFLQEISFTAVLTHTGSQPASYAIEAAGHTAGLIVEPEQTPLLQPGETLPVQIRVAAPVWRAWTVVSARSLTDGLTRAWAVLESRRAAP